MKPEFSQLSEAEQRALVVKEALEWEHTPFRHRNSVKRLGADCVGYLKGVFLGVGAIEDFETPEYSIDVYLHRSEEIYLPYLQKFLHPTIRTDPGNVISYQWGRLKHAHALIVVEWPVVIGAWSEAKKVCRLDGDKAPLSFRQTAIWTYWK